MKIFLKLFFSGLVFLFTPLVVFGCGDSGSIFDPFSIIILIYFLVTGFIYFKNYKKLIGDRWNIFQYVVILLVTVPSLVPVWSILFTMPVFSPFQAKAILGSGLPSSPNLDMELLIPSLAITAFLVVIFPLIFKKSWLYKWGIPSYLLLVVFLYFLSRMFLGYLCF